MLVARLHGNCHRAAELRATTLLEMFEALDVFRRPEQMELFLLACEADFRGRIGYESRDYPQAARAVDAAAIAAGQTGPAAGVAIRSARVASIREACGAG